MTVLDDDLVPVEFDSRTLANINNPTAGTFGPDGRLYVADQGGLITAFTFDDDYNVIDRDEITAISNLPDSGNVLGITFNPFEEVAPGETATLYVSQSFLFRATEEFENNVLALSGPNHSVVTEIITGLPVSGFDHGINGLQFDGEGSLLIAVGGNTNTGVFDGVFGSDAPESPLTSAVLRARISDPNFNGNVVYEFINPNDPDLLALANELNTAPDPNNQLFGEFVQVVDVPGEVEVETFAVGLRNSYDLVYTTQGNVFATDNGPNGIARDELNFVPEGAFLGHPSIPRGQLDPRQSLENAFEIDTDGDGTPDAYDPTGPVAAGLTPPLAELQSSTNGIDEFRSEVFGGQLQGQLIAQRFNNQVFFFELDAAGTGLVNTNSFGGGEIADGLDILTGPGGVIFGIDRNQDRITIAEPVVNNIVTSTAYDIFPFRAPAIGGNQFTIGGTNFGNINDTTVLIDGFEAELISVEDNRIVGIFPTVPSSTELRDVTVISDQTVSILEGSFLPLGEGLNEVVGRNVFFNDSFFDGNDASANAADDNAIATDIEALLPGETSSFANTTSFIHGINGIIVDANLADPSALSASDIVLSSGIGNLSSDFTLLGVNADVSVRAGEGVDGSDRITITLPNGSVTNEFLQVRVLANSTTGLSQDDVFYFGNVIGDTGDSTTDTRVDGSDVLRVQQNLSGFFGTEDVENDFDIDRDGRVDGTDVLLIQANLSPFFSSPVIITAPVLTAVTSQLVATAPVLTAVTSQLVATAPVLTAVTSQLVATTAQPDSLAVESSFSNAGLVTFATVADEIGGAFESAIPSFYRAGVSNVSARAESTGFSIEYPEYEKTELSGALSASIPRLLQVEYLSQTEVEEKPEADFRQVDEFFAAPVDGN